MPSLNGIFWLSSYPKSGNTWFRVFLANLINQRAEPIHLNQIKTGMIASCRQWMDDVLGFDSATLSHDELDALRPEIYQWHGKQNTVVGYHKIHDAYTYIAPNTPLIPTEGCLGAIYFVRNPLDVAISYANHSSCSIDEAIETMGNPKFAFCKSRFKQHNQVRQQLLSWSMHVQSWINAKDIPRLVLRYEDMTYRPVESFTKAARFLHIEATPEKIESALANAHIDKLQAFEKKENFIEKPAKVMHFFRKGIVGDWKTTLSETQVQKIIHDHGDTMHMFGYLDEERKPVEDFTKAPKGLCHREYYEG